jgi:hypothetical protein
LVYLSDGLAERPLGELIKQAQNLMTGGASSSGDLVETRSGGQADTSPGSSGVFGRDATMELGRFQQETERWQSTSTIAAVVAEASSYGVTLFVAKPPPGDAEASSRRSKSRGALIDLTDLREGLHTLADGSGGFASTSATSLAGFLPEVIEGVASHHYSLGLSAAGKADGEYTAIEVKVKQRGAQARYRSGYIKKSLSSRISERALAGLELGQSDNPHLIEVHIDSMTAASEGDPSGVGESGDVEVQFRIEVPIRNLELIHRNGLRVADARLVVVAMDEDRKLTAAQHLALPLEVPDAAWDEARSSHYRGSITLRLPAGQERVAVGLWDDIAKAGSILTDTLTVSAR